MNRARHASFHFCGLAVTSATLIGCGGQPTGPTTPRGDASAIGIFAVSARDVGSGPSGRADAAPFDRAIADSYTRRPREDPPPRGPDKQRVGRESAGEGRSRPVRPLPIADWIPSGRMGDAENPDGPLSYRLVEGEPSAPGPYEEWSYDPAKGGHRGWAAVAYQSPDSNWGDARGKDLSRRGFTRLTFRARCRSGIATLTVRSGGHTRPGAPCPASYESDPVVIRLDRDFRTYSIDLEGLDLSNVPAAFTFVLRGGPCVFDLRDITFRGTDD